MPVAPETPQGRCGPRPRTRTRWVPLPRRLRGTTCLPRNGSRKGRTGELDHCGSASPHGMTVWRRISEGDSHRRQRSHPSPTPSCGSEQSQPGTVLSNTSRAPAEPLSLRGRPSPWEPVVRCQAPPGGRGDPGPCCRHGFRWQRFKAFLLCFLSTGTIMRVV